MSKSPIPTDPLALWMDDHPVRSSTVINLLRRQGQMATLVKELILDKTLTDVALEVGEEERLLGKFRDEQKLDSEESFSDFLNRNQLTESLLLKTLTRPHRVVRYREERWGPRAKSLYLKHKDRYDLITYRRLQSGSADVMQEVFFRLKDKEESWESLARQFPNTKANADARIGPLPVGQLEPLLLEELRKAGPGVIIRPLKLKDQVLVAELESLEGSKFNDELSSHILREEFDTWLKEECSKMLSKLRFPE